MRDVITSVAAFLILAILATGVYLAHEHYQRARASTSVNAPQIADLESIINTLLGGSPATPAVAPPVPTLTPTPPTRPRQSGTPSTPLPPPPTPQALPTPTPVTTSTTTVARYPYTLQHQPRHDNACGGDLIAGAIQDAHGNPLAGIIVRLEENGHVQTTQTANNGEKKGHYEFRLSPKPQRVFIGIIDEGGNPLSPRVEILHLLPDSGYEAFHCHYIDWQYNR